MSEVCITGQTDHFVEQGFSEGLDSIGIGFYRFNRDGILVDYNNTTAELFGIKPFDNAGSFHFSRLDHVLQTDLSKSFESILASGKPCVKRDMSCINDYGQFQVVNMFCVHRRNPDDGSDEVAGIIEDTSNKQTTDMDLRNKLKILTDVAAALSSSLSLDQTLKVILTSATASQGLGFNRAFLFLYDSNMDRLTGHIAVGPSSPEEANNIWSNLDTTGVTLSELLDLKNTLDDRSNDSINNLIKNMVIDLNTDSIIRQACKSPRWVKVNGAGQLDPVTISFLKKIDSQNVVLIPMISKNRLIGLLAADNYITRDQISDKDVEMLQTLANHASVAMERAGLYDTEKQRAQELQRINTLLAHSQDQIIKFEKMSVIGELTSAIAHEIRNPLTIIGGFANLMLQGNIPDDQREYLNIISSETQRTEKVLNELLDFHKASKGKDKVVQFAGIIRRNLDLLKSRLNRPNIEFTLEEVDESLMVLGNLEQLSHAVYQVFFLLAEELMPNASIILRIKGDNNRAVLDMKIKCVNDRRDHVMKIVKQIFNENKTSQRLMILVAGETIKCHGGNFGLAQGNDRNPVIYIELPQAREDRIG